LRSTLVTSQLPTNHRHEIIADQTLADAILDRLVYNEYRINLKERRIYVKKKKSDLTQK
jgi:DNA replication protein DnaC